MYVRCEGVAQLFHWISHIAPAPSSHDHTAVAHKIEFIYLYFCMAFGTKSNNSVSRTNKTTTIFVFAVGLSVCWCGRCAVQKLRVKFYWLTERSAHTTTAHWWWPHEVYAVDILFFFSSSSLCVCFPYSFWWCSFFSTPNWMKHLFGHLTHINYFVVVNAHFTCSAPHNRFFGRVNLILSNAIYRNLYGIPRLLIAKMRNNFSNWMTYCVYGWVHFLAGESERIRASILSHSFFSSFFLSFVVVDVVVVVLCFYNAMFLPRHIRLPVNFRWCRK